MAGIFKRVKLKTHALLLSKTSHRRAPGVSPYPAGAGTFCGRSLHLGEPRKEKGKKYPKGLLFRR